MLSATAQANVTAISSLGTRGDEFLEDVNVAGTCSLNDVWRHPVVDMHIWEIRKLRHRLRRSLDVDTLRKKSSHSVYTACVDSDLVKGI